MSPKEHILMLIRLEYFEQAAECIELSLRDGEITREWAMGLKTEGPAGWLEWI